MAIGANEHPCAVAPLGYVLVPELPQYLQVLSISNSFCIHICHRRTSSKTVVELCKDIFNPQKKNFAKRDSLFCDSFFPCILHAARPAALRLPAYVPKGTLHMAIGTLYVAKGTSLKEKIPPEQMPRRDLSEAHQRLFILAVKIN